MKRNFLALGSASILILAGAVFAVPATAQTQAQPQDQSQTQNQSPAAQDQAPAKAKVMHHRHARTQSARQEAKEDRSEDRVTAQLNQQQLAQAGNENASSATMMNTGNAAQPNATPQSAQSPDNNRQTNNCAAAGSGANCSTPTPNSNGASPGPSK